MKDHTITVSESPEYTGPEMQDSISGLLNGRIVGVGVKHAHDSDHAECEGVSNTITQLRFLGCVFLELQYWANRVKYVFLNISKL